MRARLSVAAGLWFKVDSIKETVYYWIVDLDFVDPVWSFAFVALIIAGLIDNRDYC